MNDIEKHLPGSLGIASRAQSALARHFIEARNLVVEEVDQGIKKEFVGSIVSVYRSSIGLALNTAGGDPVTITEKLEMHRTSQWRWMKERVGPNFETYCLALAAFDADLGPQVPRGREAVIQGIASTLSFLRVNVTKGGDAVPTRSDIIYLHFASLSKHWWIAANTGLSHHVNNAVESIHRKIFRANERVALLDAEAIGRVLDQWNSEWCLFHCLPPYGWLFELRE